jgi:uncharacterized membrane protein YraQ (UPF0718 family)
MKNIALSLVIAVAAGLIVALLYDWITNSNTQLNPAGVASIPPATSDPVTNVINAQQSANPTGLQITTPQTPANTDLPWYEEFWNYLNPPTPPGLQLA